MLNFLGRTFKDEYHVIQQAPYSFFIFTCLGAITCFFVLSWYYDGRIETAKEKSELYEMRLEASSPDKAVEKIAAIHDGLDDAFEKIQKLNSEKGLLFNKNPTSVILKDPEDKCSHPETPKGPNRMQSDTAIFLLKQWAAIEYCRSLIGKKPDSSRIK